MLCSPIYLPNMKTYNKENQQQQAQMKTWGGKFLIGSFVGWRLFLRSVWGKCEVTFRKIKCSDDLWRSSLSGDWISSWMKLTTQTSSRHNTKMFFSSQWSLDHESNKKCSDAVHSITFHLVEASFSRRHGQLKKKNLDCFRNFDVKRQHILRKCKILCWGVF